MKKKYLLTAVIASFAVMLYAPALAPQAQASKYFIDYTVNFLTIDTGGLVGHWTFDGKDMKQNVKDSSGDANNGDLIGYTSTTSVAGKVGQALQFNGTSQYATVPANAVFDSTNFTLSAWVKINGTGLVGGGNNSILSSGFSPGRFYLYAESSDNKITLDLPFIASNVVTSNTALTFGKWYHVLLTKNGTSYTIYINGLTDNSANNGSTLNTGLPIEIGGLNGTTQLMNGSIDDTRIYNRALSAAEVKQLYNASASTIDTTINVPNINSDIVGHWTFDGKDMLRNVKDSSGQGNNGDLIGFTSTTSVAGKVGQALQFNGTSQYVSEATSISNIHSVAFGQKRQQEQVRGS